MLNNAVMDASNQMSRIAESPIFRNCPRLIRFLRFVIEEAPRGGLKERLIGMEVFGRPADYDAGADPIVRVEARRLRRKLAEYYAGPGSADPIEIVLPKGSYAPALVPRQNTHHSLSVMPFAGDSHGLTARIITRLAATGFLRVFRETEDAELVLDGSLRQAGARFRCDSQLVSPHSGLHVWAGSFDCEANDAFEMEDDFAARIAEGVCRAFRETYPTIKA